MKNLLPLLALLLVLSACRDDFSLEGDYQDLPVAYAYLNAADERQFVRVEKAFLEAGGNAEAVAGIADSIYYAPGAVTVVLENLSNGQSAEMRRVDARDFGLNRTDGIFAQTPNVAYAIETDEIDLRGDHAVRLTLARPGEEDAVAETQVLREFSINRPTMQVRVDDYPRPVVVTWEKIPGAAIYDVTLVFNIRELFPSNPDQNRTVQLTWPVSTSFVPGGDQASERFVRFEILSESFYQFIGAELQPIDGVVRRFDNFDIRVAAAGQEVLDRRNLENANAGITSSQSLPRYTNLIGGLGLITSFSQAERDGILFDGGSLDSLELGVYTRDLGFR